LELRETRGFPLQEALIGYLEKKHILLVLDNCEHLLAECVRLVDLLLKACPGLVILATSREILGVNGEDTLRVPPLALPDARQPPELEMLGKVEAVKLWVERARQALPGFVLEDDNAPHVVKICLRLEGIPLALELAAARLRMMTIAQVADRLDNVFLLLTGGSRSALPRQQTLRATMDWSYALLSPKERLALQRLSVFAGGWTLEAAESVCSGNGIQKNEVLDFLGGLVDKSLVALTNEERYTMLEIVRQFAQEELLENGKGENTRDLHLSYFLQLGEVFAKEVRGKEQIFWLDRLDRELDNLRLALEWSVVRHILVGLRLASALLWFWSLRSHFTEGIAWLKRLLAEEAEIRGGQSLALGSQTNDYLLAWVRTASAVVHLAGFPTEQSQAVIAESVALCRQMGDLANHELAWVLHVTGDSIAWSSLAQVLSYLEESLAICRRNGYSFLLARNLMVIGYIHMENAHWQVASPYLEEGLAIFRQIEDPNGIAIGLRNSSALASFKGEYAQAYAFDTEAQEYYRKASNLNALHDDYLWQVYPAVELGIESQVFPLAEAALDYFRDKGNPAEIRFTLIRLCEMEWARGNLDKSQVLAQEACELSCQAHNPHHAVFSYCMLFRIAFAQGDLATARQWLKSASTWLTESRYPYPLTETLSDWVMLLTAEGKHTQAIKVSAVVDETFQNMALWITRCKREAYANAQVRLRQALSEEAFTQIWHEGKSLTLQQVLEEVKREAGLPVL